MDQQASSAKNAFLASLSQKDFKALAPHLTSVALDHKSILHEAGEPIRHLYFPTSGAISLVRHLQSGIGVETGMVGREGVLGSSVALGMNNSANQAIVQIGGSASKLSKNHFIAAYEASDGLKASVGLYLNKVLSEAQQLSACNATHDLESRMCRWLLQARDRTGQNKLPLTQEFLAQMLGVQRTTVTLVESRLETAGLLKSHRGYVEIVSAAKMRQAACECYEVMSTGRPN
jgi:CRP-like cAMP-binding protein